MVCASLNVQWSVVWAPTKQPCVNRGTAEGVIGQIMLFQIPPAAFNIEFGDIPAQALNEQPWPQRQGLNRGVSSINRAVVEYEDNWNLGNARLPGTLPVEFFRQVHKVRAAFSRPDQRGERSAFVFQQTEHRPLAALTWYLDKQPRTPLSSVVGEIKAREHFRSALSKQANITGLDLLAHRIPFHAGAFNRLSVLSFFESAAGPTSSEASFLCGNMLSRAKEIETPHRCPISAFSRGSVHNTSSASSRICQAHAKVDSPCVPSALVGGLGAQRRTPPAS